jgi:hypothetical protein
MTNPASKTSWFKTCVMETKRMHLVLLACRQGKFGPYLSRLNRILISVMMEQMRQQ